MSRSEDPVALKKRLSPRLLGLPGVSGVGLPNGRLTVYLESDDPQIRSQVQDAAAKLAPGVSLAFEVTGAFRAQ